MRPVGNPGQSPAHLRLGIYLTRHCRLAASHGCIPSLIDAVVTDSNYAPGVDRLIFAGDAVEIGRDSLGCLERLAQLGAECLVGNHDYAYFTADPIENEPLDERLIGPLTSAIASGRWKLAAEADIRVIDA